MPRRPRHRAAERPGAPRPLRVEPLEPRRVLATLIVDTPLDIVDDTDGVTSLREAVDTANLTPGADDIVFDFGVDGPVTILLNDGELSITDDLTITGDGAELLTIDAQQLSRIFKVGEDNASETIDVGFHGLTLANGTASDGGAVANDSGIVTISNSILRDNASAYGGAIGNHGALHVVASTLTDNQASVRGGAVSSSGDMTITDSYFSDNVSFSGGAILNLGQLDVTSSTFSGNTALRDTLFTLTKDGAGGAINNLGELTVVNGTFVGNYSGRQGGAIKSDTPANTSEGNVGLTLLHSTVTGNVAGTRGGGIYFRGTSPLGNYFENSIITGNSGTSGDVFNLVHAELRGTNLIDVPVQSVFAGVTTLPIAGALPSGALADNGGPVPTVALLDDAQNPAVDTIIDSLGPATDARGVPRGIDPEGLPGFLADVGAYEIEEAPGASYTVTTPLDTGDDATVTTTDVLAEAADGDGLSLREAVLLANATPGVGHIDFDFGVDGPVTVFLEAGELLLADNVIITGDGKDLLTIDAQNQSRVFRVGSLETAGAAAVISGVTMANGYATPEPITRGDGGAVDVAGALAIVDSVVRDSTAEGQGGGIAVREGLLKIVRSTVSGNTSMQRPNFPPYRNGFPGGGGIYSRTSNTVIDQSLLVDNESYFGEGGAIRSRYGGSLTISNSTLSGNRAARHGSGISAADYGPFVKLTSSTIVDNVQTGRLLNFLPLPAVFLFDQSGYEITNTLIANNLHTTFAGSLEASDPFSATGNSGQPAIVSHSLLASTLPGVGPLADLGGPTMTHSLLPGSPAIDAGDPEFVGPPDTDQRGDGFARVVDAGSGTPRIDIGAFEVQEDLSTIPLVVTTTEEADGELSPGDVSLREAIQAASSSFRPGHDEITFAPGVVGTIFLDQGELSVTESLTITGPGQDVVTIDAQQQSRVVDISGPLENGVPTVLEDVDLTINGLTLQNGLTSGDAQFEQDHTYRGGGVRFLSTGTLTIADSTIKDNQSSGERAAGGGVFLYGGRYGYNPFGGSLVLNRSVVTGNRAVGNGERYRDFDEVAGGGGINANGQSISISDSIVSNNSTEGYGISGGGIRARAAYTNDVPGFSVTRSIITGNQTFGESSGGGGVFTLNRVVLRQSLISGNRTHGRNSGGGGLFAFVISDSSTISGNTTRGLFSPGGGITGGGVIMNSTIVNNHAEQSDGGGVYYDEPTEIGNSVIASNRAGSGSLGDDIREVRGSISIRNSLVGDNTGSGLAASPTPDNDGNLIGSADNPINPRLGPLADHGGPTKTHALLPGSPAIDRGNPEPAVPFVQDPDEFEPPEFDQRGAGFARVVDGGFGLLADIGAFESQGVPLGFPTGDTNQDGIVTAADYAVARALGLPLDEFRQNFGNVTIPVAPNGNPGDHNGDNAVTASDYAVARDRGAGIESFRQHFGVAYAAGTAAASSADATADPLAEAFALLAPAAGDRLGEKSPIEEIASAIPGDELLLTLLVTTDLDEQAFLDVSKPAAEDQPRDDQPTALEVDLRVR